MEPQGRDRIWLRRSSKDPQLPPGTVYYDWDRGNERERAERWVRTERVTSPDGRVGEAVEWEETIHYRPGGRREIAAAPPSAVSEIARLLRGVVVIVGGFSLVSLCYVYAGVPLIVCWALYLIACWWLL